MFVLLNFKSKQSKFQIKPQMVIGISQKLVCDNWLKIT